MTRVCRRGCGCQGAAAVCCSLLWRVHLPQRSVEPLARCVSRVQKKSTRVEGAPARSNREIRCASNPSNSRCSLAPSSTQFIDALADIFERHVDFIYFEEGFLGFVGAAGFLQRV